MPRWAAGILRPCGGSDWAMDQPMEPSVSARTTETGKWTAPMPQWVASVRVLYSDGIVEAPARVLFPGRLAIGRALTEKEGLALPCDAQVSRHLHAVLQCHPGSPSEPPVVEVLDGGSKNGLFVQGQPVLRHVLRDGDILRLGRSFLLFRCQPRDARLQDAVLPELPGRSAAMCRLRHQLSQAATSDASILLLGETGTGKELAARALHSLLRQRRTGDFVDVNCPGISDSLAEGLIFGHGKGAFTGALGEHPGFFRQADGGTLFLDEVAELSERLQTMLLRVLEQREVLPLRATRNVPVDFRLISATNRPLEQLSAEGTFRDDLYARLGGQVIELPPLRERREDILLLLLHHMRKLGLAAERNPPLTVRLTETLLTHFWPHNVRQLVHVARELMQQLSSGDELDLSPAVERLLRVADVHRSEFASPQPSPPRSAAPSQASLDGQPPDEAGLQPGSDSSEQLLPNRESVYRLLVQMHGRVSDVAAALGISRRTLGRVMERYGFARQQFRRPR